MEYRAARATITVEEMAVRLGIGRNLAYELAATGQVPSIRLGHRRLVIPLVAFERWLEEQAQPAGAQ